MENPEAGGQGLPAKTMYAYATHRNIPWNMKEYQVPQNPFDHKQIQQERLYASQKKGVKVNDYYLTRRGFYMDYDLKVSKGVPSSCVHGKQEPWDATKSVLEGDLLQAARTSSKFTIYDRMEKKQSRHPVPGVSTYRLEKSLEELSQLLEKNKNTKVEQGPKRYFHEDTTFLSEQSPGAGHYNPHQSVDKLHLSRQNWKTMTKRHDQWNKIMAKRELKKPDPGTYSPVHQNYQSFSSIERKTKKLKAVKNGFGSDARFPYVRASKKVVVEKRPSPNSYQTKIQWKDKSVSPKKKEWYKMVWKGSSSGVYH